VKRSHLRLLRFLLGKTGPTSNAHAHLYAHGELILCAVVSTSKVGAGEPAEVRTRAEWLDTGCCANVAWITEELEEN